MGGGEGRRGGGLEFDLQEVGLVLLGLLETGRKKKVLGASSGDELLEGDGITLAGEALTGLVGDWAILRVS